MSCERLICAYCGGPVVEARCPVCRHARAELHHSFVGTVSSLVAAAILLFIAAFVALRFAL